MLTGHPYDFFRGVAEDTFRGRIPRGDDAVEILADDRIVGKLNDRLKSLCNLNGTIARSEGSTIIRATDRGLQKQ